MFIFNTKTQVDKKFTLRELYKVMGADKAVKADAEHIISVTLKNVLNTDTLNFAVSDTIKEIYVFDIELNSKTIPSLFLSALDKAINLHTVFVLRCGDEALLYGAYKEYGEKGIKIGKFYATEWATDKAITLPLTVTSLDDIYTAIIDELIPIAARAGENTRDFVDRYDEIVKLRKQIEKLQRAVDSEKQSKKRFELNAELKQVKMEVSRLL